MARLEDQIRDISLDDVLKTLGVKEEEEVEKTPAGDSVLSVVKQGHVITITYNGSDLELSVKTREDLNNLVLEPLLSQSKSARIKSYASGTPGESNSDRRIALLRGLRIRDFLMNQGAEAAQINV